MSKSLLRVLLALAALVLAGCGTVAPTGSETQPDGRGERVTAAPGLPSQQLPADAPIPAEMHQQNTGGSDGQGLCVIAAGVTSGRFQGWGPEVAKLWEEAKRRPGGYYSQKLDQLIASAAPNLRYAHYHGNDYGVLKRLSASGIPVNVTMGTGSLYNYQTVAHMVTGIHFDDRWACMVDNNAPGRYYWMPAEVFQRRWKIPAGEGWAFSWADNRVRAGVGAIALLVILTGGASFAFGNDGDEEEEEDAAA